MVEIFEKNVLSNHKSFRIVLVDTDDKILLTGEIRNIFDEMSTRATVLVWSIQ